MKKRKRLIWQLYPPYLALILLSLLAVSWYTSRSLNSFFIDRNRSELETHARIIEGRLQTPVALSNTDILDALCKDIGKNTPIRLTLILPSGLVVGDSNETPRHMENHGNREEVISALRGEIGTSVRFSNTLRQNMMYLALPLKQDGRITAVIRTAIPLTDVENATRSLQLKIGFFGFIIVSSKIDDD